MKSKVYFIRTSNEDSKETIKTKFSKLILESNMLEAVSENDKVVIKIHFGEQGNTGHVKPEYVKVFSDVIADKASEIIISDTNTLYKGKRSNSEDHLQIACKHGFTKENTGADICIPDDKVEGNTVKVNINQNFVKIAKISKVFLDTDVLVNISHFKGHIMTGCAGALKNIGMGCATREGKLEQHTDVSPCILEASCIGCGECVEICPVDAVSLKQEKAYLDSEKCIGCASCIAVCPVGAIGVNWESGADNIQEKMVEYAKPVFDKNKGKILNFNFALKITEHCDCLAKDDPRIAPDIGIFASFDPVSVDKACLDFVTDICEKDIFKQVHPNRDGLKQMIYASKLGLGYLEYDLIEIK